MVIVTGADYSRQRGFLDPRRGTKKAPLPDDGEAPRAGWLFPSTALRASGTEMPRRISG